MYVASRFGKVAWNVLVAAVKDAHDGRGTDPRRVTSYVRLMHAVIVVGPTSVLRVAVPADGSVGRLLRALTKNSQMRTIVEVGVPTELEPPELT